MVAPFCLREASETMGCVLRRCKISTLCSLFTRFWDIVCNWSFSHNVKLHSLMFMHTISTRNPLVYLNLLSLNCGSKEFLQYREWSPDRKWSHEKLRNGMDRSWILDEEWGCLQRNFRGKKGTFSSRPLKKKGRRKPDHRPVCVCIRGGGGYCHIWATIGYMGYIGMCRCEVYGFQAVYSGIGYINQRVCV